MVVVAAAADTVGSIREAYRATWMRASIGERARGPCSVVRGEGPANRMNDGRMRARARRGGRRAQKKTGTTAPAFVRMAFCDEEGLGFVAGCEKDAGVANAVADMV